MDGPGPGPGPAIDIADLPPEYVNANNAGRIVGLVGAFHFLALTFVSLRVYVRVFMVRAFGVDDAFIIAACLLALGSWICLIMQIPFGLGRHGLVVPVEDRIQFERITFWKTVFSDGVALGLLRVSMAVSLLRLKKDLKWYRWSLFAVMGFVVAYSIQAIAWLFIYCTPFSGWWEFQWMNPFDERCHDFNLFVNLVYWNIACNIFTDVVLGALPIPIIWNLKMKLRVRLYVIGILNLGYLAVLAGILKAVFMLTTGGDPDQIFDYWVHVWQNLQLNIGIVAACASFLKPLVGRLLKINSTIGYSSYPSHNRYYGRSGRTPLGVETIGSSYHPKPGRRGDHTPATSHPDDEFELHTKTSRDDIPSDFPPPRHNTSRTHTHEPHRSDSPSGVTTTVTVRAARHHHHPQQTTPAFGQGNTQAGHRHRPRHGSGSTDAVDAVDADADADGPIGMMPAAPPSDTNSEEIILQKQEPVLLAPGGGAAGTRGIMISRDVSVRYSPK